MGSRPCMLGTSKKKWDNAFLDIVAVLGAHFNFGYEEYRNMKITTLIGLLNRYDSHMKKLNRRNRRG